GSAAAGALRTVPARALTLAAVDNGCDVLAADAKPDDARRDALENGKTLHQAQQSRRLRYGRAVEVPADDPVLNGHLQSLGHARRPQAPALDSFERAVRHLMLAQRRGEDVGGGNRVLNSEIDADAADRRHRVGRVTDGEEAGLRPLLEPVDAHR